MLALGLNIGGRPAACWSGYVGFYAVGAYNLRALRCYFRHGFWTASVAFAGAMCGAVWPPARLPGTAPARDYMAHRDAGVRRKFIRILLNNMTW